MFDFVHLRENLPNTESISFEHLELKLSYSDGLKIYSLSNGFNKIKVKWKNGMLDVSGSIPCYWQGHNFEFSDQNFHDAFLDIANKLGLADLWKAEVVNFEFGKVVEVVSKPSTIFSKHIRLSGFRRKLYENGVYFNNSNLDVKVYNAGHRMKTAHKCQIRHMVDKYGFDRKKAYIRIENRYKRPEIIFKNRAIELQDLLRESFQNEILKDLKVTYRRIEKMKPLKMPKDKKNLTTSTIAILCLQKMAKELNVNYREFLFDFLNEIPTNVLPTNDKSKRRKNIRKDFEKLEVDSGILDGYDLADILDSAFS